MSDPAAARAYLAAEIDHLEPLDFVFARPVSAPLHAVEVTRGEDRALEVRVPGRPPVIPALTPEVRASLGASGFTSEDPEDPSKPWVKAAADADAAVDCVQALFREVFGEKPDAPLDIFHGSHRLEHEAMLKLAAVRQRIQRIAAELTGKPVPQDSDGDYVLGLGDVRVIVAPRALPGGPLLVRVFSITNTKVKVVPELGLFLARLNFGMTFGRFALDSDNASIWFDETLLGDQWDDDALRFTIRVVASTADEWDDRLKQMFGGVTYQEALQDGAHAPEPTTKPGQGGYL